MAVLGTDRAVDDLPLVAALVAAMNRLLLVAIATAKPRFTTDPAVAWRAAVRADEETTRLAASARRALATSAVQYAIEPISYRAGDSPARREHRIAAAATRFARRRNAVLLPNWSPWSVPDHWGNNGLSTASVSTGQGAPILAVLGDSLDAVCTASAAGHLAITLHSPLVLGIPVATSCTRLDHWAGACGRVRVMSETAAIAARVQPVLDHMGVRALVLPAGYRADPRPAVAARRAVDAVHRLAGQLTVRTVVTTAGSATATRSHPPVRTVYLVHPCAGESDSTRGDRHHTIGPAGKVVSPHSPQPCCDQPDRGHQAPSGQTRVIR